MHQFSKSVPDQNLPNAGELQALYRLIHELCELGTSTAVWREHFLIEMEKVVNAPVSVSYLMRFSLDPNDIGPKTLFYMERGTNDAWKRYLAAFDTCTSACRCLACRCLARYGR